MPFWKSASRTFPGSHACHRRTCGMKIVDVQFYKYRLPFRNSFATAHGVMTVREGMIVEITTECGVSGVGEIAPLPAFGGASLADDGSLLAALAQRLHAKTLDEALELVLATGKAGTKAISAPILCGLEVALLDAIGKAEGYGVATLLSPPDTVPRTVVPVNAVIGARAPNTAIAAAQETRKQGYRCVKLKVAFGDSIQHEVERIAAVRDAIGPAIHLRLDANEAWNMEEAISFLSQCVPYTIEYVEQPLKAHDLAGMCTLRQAVPIPIAVDEALYSLESAQLILDSEAADVFVIKPQLVGGLRAGQHIIQTAVERGVKCVITGTFESGIGVVAALHLAAASPAITLECGLATLDLLVDDLVTDALPVRDGYLAVPVGPGLGVALDREALAKYSIRGSG